MEKLHFVDKIIRDTYTVEYEEKPRHEFRTSSLPYCPIVDFQSWVENEPGSCDYGMNFYTRIGTQVHENLQNMSGMSKYGPYVYGSWKCPECGHIHEKCFRPYKCEKCKHRLLEYVELDFNYKGLSGHLDMLACYPTDIEGNFRKLTKEERKDFLATLQKDHNIDTKKYRHKWCAFEYKTTGTKYITVPYLQKYIPNPKHYGQVEAYCVMLDLLYDIKVSEYAIIYFSRECPIAGKNYMYKAFPFEWTKEKYAFRLMTIERAAKGRKYVEKAMESLDDKKIRDKYVEKLIKVRPCKNKKDWEVYCKKGYFGNEECPYLKICCSDRVNVKKVLKDVDLK